MTEAQRNASRKNGSKSKGPTSQRGKNNSKLNALKTGLFSNQSVIPFLDERPEDFDNLKRQLRARFQPNDIVTEMLVHDCAVGWSKMKRLEKAAAAEVRNHCVQNKIADREKVRAVDSLKDRFFQSYQEIVARCGPNLQLRNFAIEMDEVRSQLMMTSSGISFLIEILESAWTDLSTPESNPHRTLCLIAACTGVANSHLNNYLFTLAEVRKRTEGPQPFHLSEAEGKFDPNSIELLKLVIGQIELVLLIEQMITAKAEKTLAGLRVDTAPLLPSEIANRISRAGGRCTTKLLQTSPIAAFERIGTCVG